MEWRNGWLSLPINGIGRRICWKPRLQEPAVRGHTKLAPSQRVQYPSPVWPASYDQVKVFPRVSISMSETRPVGAFRETFLGIWGLGRHICALKRLPLLLRAGHPAVCLAKRDEPASDGKHAQDKGFPDVRIGQDVQSRVYLVYLGGRDSLNVRHEYGFVKTNKGKTGRPHV